MAAISKRIFLNENVWISIKISPKFVHQGPINDIPALVQIMAWYRPDDKPLSELIWLDYWRIYASLGLNELNDFTEVGIEICRAVASHTMSNMFTLIDLIMNDINTCGH